tara:strand:- start:86 stop:229 length:144 start_codon:yes stop_codon:yes gene_type:complete
MISLRKIKNTLFWCFYAIKDELFVEGIEIFKSHTIYLFIKKIGANLI